jgi:hypothetical protein
MRLLPLVLLFGCFAGAGYSTLDKVTAAAREYNEDVRWGRWQQASLHVPSERRRHFVERHKSLEDDLEFADYEVTSLDVDKSNKKMTTALVRVEYSWTLKSTGLVEKTATEQRWEEHDGDWVVASETRVKGAPLSLFEETPRVLK